MDRAGSRSSGSGGSAQPGGTRKRAGRLSVITLALMALIVSALPAVAAPPRVSEAVETFEWTRNMHPMGFSERVPLTVAPPLHISDVNSDLAFWGNHAFQGHWTGFRIIDISAPANMREVASYDECGVGRESGIGGQGDVVVWDDILVRSWDGAAGGMCGDLPGVSGLHVFDISDLTDPQPVGFVDLECGSHTATGVPDLENNRLLVYNSSSSAACPFVEIVEVPLDAPEDIAVINEVDAGQRCHDIGVILGDAMLAACAGTIAAPFDPDDTGVTVFSMHPDDGGSLDDPVFLHQSPTPGIGIGHSAAFTWDGELILIGHEPGGGLAPFCTEDDPPEAHTLWFMDSRSGDIVGGWELERKITDLENCTIHNYNVVPTDKAYVVVMGNYQAGINVVDFTDPANPFEFAWAEPEPLIHPDDPDPDNPSMVFLGGSWSAYWYNGLIYDTDIRRGLISWRLSDPRVGGAKKLPHLNPQTQEFTIEKGPAFGRGPRGRP
jgi:hypothetical protein